MYVMVVVVVVVVVMMIYVTCSIQLLDDACRMTRLTKFITITITIIITTPNNCPLCTPYSCPARPL